MKKLTGTLLVAMITVTMAFSQVIGGVGQGPYFTIKNKSTGAVKTAPVEDFIVTTTAPWGKAVRLDGGVCNGDQIEITYNSFAPFQLAWFYGWLGYSDTDNPLGSEPTVTVTVNNVPTSRPLYNIFLVECDYLGTGYGGGTPESYLIRFLDVSQESRVTAKNINASEVQVTYANYEEIVSTGQRATVALYDIYGNPVSTGYLDNLGMSTLSTKGKPGIYIVKVIMNNQVIFNQRIQVK